MNDLSRSSFFDLSGGVYTAGYDLLACTSSTHSLADNKLVSSVFFPMISFVSASKTSFDFFVVL